MALPFTKVMPMLDRIFVKRAAKKLTTSTGILMPDKKSEKMLEGIVMAVGPGARDPETGECIPIDDIKVGDRVLIPEYGGLRVEMPNDKKQEYLLFRETEIFAKIEHY